MVQINDITKRDLRYLAEMTPLFLQLLRNSDLPLAYETHEIMNRIEKIAKQLETCKISECTRSKGKRINESGLFSWKSMRR